MWDVMDPVTTYNNLLKGWWKIAVLAFVGGLLGLVMSFILPPAYQAEAIFHASIDFTKINYENMVGEYGEPLVWTQYEEDIALQIVERILLSEIGDAFRYARTLDPELDMQTFKNDKQIERYLTKWYLRYRHEDPEIAQAVVNFWADNGMKALCQAQESESAETFVIVDLLSEASEPGVPVYHNRSTLVLSGTVIGFLIGILVVDFSYRFVNRRKKEV